MERRLQTSLNGRAGWRDTRRIRFAAALFTVIAIAIPSAAAVAGTNPSFPIAGNSATSAFGNNSVGQLWNTVGNSSTPVVPGGFSATVTLDTYNGGTKTVTNPCTAATMAKATMISAGGDLGMALIAKGYVCVWGDNYWGEEAQGDHAAAAGPGNNPTGTDGPVPVCLPESWTLLTGPATGYGYCNDKGTLLSGVTSISAGGAFGMALMGTGSTIAKDTTVAPPIAASKLPKGAVATWGANYNGQLGSNWSANSPTAPYGCSGGNNDCAWAPVAVAGGACGNTTNQYIDGVSGISAGYNFALTKMGGTTGTVATACSWGDNTYGELGLGGSSNVTTPGGDSPNFCPYVGASGSSYCSWTPQPVTSDCDGQQTSSGTPGTLSDIYDIEAGLGISVALLTDQHVCTWGDNTHGELGIGTNIGPDSCSNNNAAPPSPINCGLSAQEVLGGSCDTATDLGGAYQISAGEFDAYALISGTPWSGGTVCTWGDGAGGGLGNGGVADSFLPVPVLGVNGIGYLGTATCISAGDQHGLAVLDPSAATDGTLVTWGSNAADQNNGPPNPVAGTLWPVDVMNAAVPPAVVEKVSSISAGLGEWNLYTSGTKGCEGPPPLP